MPRFAEPGQGGQGQAGQGDDVQPDQRLLGLGPGGGRGAERADAGVVDQQGGGLGLQPRLQRREVLRIGEVEDQRLDFDAVRGLQLRRQLGQAVRAAGDQQQVMALCGQAIGIGRADSRRGAGDDGHSPCVRHLGLPQAWVRGEVRFSARQRRSSSVSGLGG
ncbi:hypothetical protein GALL_516450 [mine drainage metagenome]|uniref:Uncharacterized protein n=1 Tax=mine drainage metagenome TaxID=410659 RepID=A0A1J5P5H2_9ZZZZ